jgi:hypothetical protein
MTNRRKEADELLETELRSEFEARISRAEKGNFVKVNKFAKHYNEKA